MAEAGIREVLRTGIGLGRVSKEGRQLVGSAMTFNPDLVFDGGKQVGDVKYKQSGGDWPRSDLYQAVAYAEVFGAIDAALVRFRDPKVSPISPVHVGKKTVTEFCWVTDENLSPQAAADDLVA